jgi:ABC-type sugar transport system substrate-binding protein
MISMTKYAQDKGWQVVTSNANFDADAQANEVDYWISLGVDAIVVVPIDSKAICASVKKAKDAGIPFFTIDRAPIGCVIDMTVQADNALAGQQSATAIVQFLKTKYGSEKGTVLELQGDMGQNVAQLRSSGFNDYIKQFPNITVISKPTEWKGEKFQSATLDVVGSQPVDAIYAHSDTVGSLPILSALDQLKKKVKAGDPNHIFLATVDGSATCLDNIRAGFQDQCSSQPNPDFGILVNYIDMVLKGQKITEGPVVKEGAPWSPAKIVKSDTGMMLNLATTSVTAATVEDKNLWGNIVK